MFCRYCGNEIADDSAFCSKCGKRVKEDNANSSSTAKNTANVNDAVDKQSSAPKEENAKLDSDSTAKDSAANECVANEQAASKEERATPDSDSLGKNAANENDSVNKKDSESASKTTDETVKQTVDSVSNTVENTNPLCIAGLVLTFVMFFFNYYCIVGLAAFVLSFLGYRAAKENGQKGRTLAVVCMAVSGIASLVFIGYLIEYKRYESAVYGGINGFLDLLGL